MHVRIYFRSVLYEMTSGRMAFPGKTAAIVHAMLLTYCLREALTSH